MPGAMEPYQARDDYSARLAEVQKGGDGSRSGSKASLKKESDATKLPLVQSGHGESSFPEAAVVQDSPSSGGVYAEARIKEESDYDRQSSGGIESEKNELDGSVSESGSDDYEESDQSDAWPPSPPVLRFKMRMQFSDRFRPSEKEKALFEEMNRDLEEKIVEGHAKKIEDTSIGWLNQVFKMDVQTEYQFEVGFPIIILTMLDAIYPKRIRWREVDWRFQYKRALQKNFGVLEGLWTEVNMEKAREFRVENTTLRLENLPSASLAEKLEFLRLMKRWYDQRIHHAGPYDPLSKRLEFVEQCRAWGHTVKFPNWIKFDKEHLVEISEEDAREHSKHKTYNAMPEYKRLIWFLGCQEYQTM